MRLIRVTLEPPIRVATERPCEHAFPSIDAFLVVDTAAERTGIPLHGLKVC